MALRPQTNRLAVLGAGNVGEALLSRLAECQREGPGAAVPAPDVIGVLVQDVARQRSAITARFPLTTEADALVSAADIVVELLGGVEPAASLMLQALASGKRVVTANKAALAERWEEFVPHLASGHLYCEASVMAGTPVLGPLSGSLRGSRPLELHAVLNGTTTYIIGRLEAGDEFEEALEGAQRLGYAEADPTLDLSGLDAAHKLSILARLAFDPHLPWQQVAENTRGIERLTPQLVREAMEDGGTVRLVGSVTPAGDAWKAAVRPVYLAAGHPLAIATDSGNALLLRSSELGEVFIRGPGAGGTATAAAVVGDLLDALSSRPGPRPLAQAVPLPPELPAADSLKELPGL